MLKIHHTFHAVPSQLECLGSWVVPHDSLDLVFIRGPILLEEIVGIGLSWGVGVGVVEEILNTKENLLDGDGGLPVLLLVENRQADSAGRVHVGVEQGRDEFACGLSALLMSEWRV